MTYAPTAEHLAVVEGRDKSVANLFYNRVKTSADRQAYR